MFNSHDQIQKSIWLHVVGKGGTHNKSKKKILYE